MDNNNIEVETLKEMAGDGDDDSPIILPTFPELFVYPCFFSRYIPTMANFWANQNKNKEAEYI